MLKQARTTPNNQEHRKINSSKRNQTKPPPLWTTNGTDRNSLALDSM